MANRSRPRFIAGDAPVLSDTDLSHAPRSLPGAPARDDISYARRRLVGCCTYASRKLFTISVKGLVTTAIGNLIADALRAQTQSDVAIVNGGGIRGNKQYPAGTELTRRDILTELPFGNRTVKLAVTGDMIKAALENGVSDVANAAGRFPQVSGLTFTADLMRPVGQRVDNIMIGGKPLDPAASYTLATNDYMAGGGDGYVALEAGTPLLAVRDGKLMANDVMAYIAAQKTVAPKVEGRIGIRM